MLFAQTAKRVFSPETLLPFLFGSLALGVLSNAVFTALTNLFGTASPAVLSIAVGSLLIHGLGVWVVSRLVRGPDATTSLPGKRSPTRRWLILLVSNKPPCEKAIEFHRPVLTAHGSVGVVLACWNRDRPMQYTPAVYDEQRKPIRPLDPIEIHIDPLTTPKA